MADKVDIHEQEKLTKYLDLNYMSGNKLSNVDTIDELSNAEFLIPIKTRNTLAFFLSEN